MLFFFCLFVLFFMYEEGFPFPPHVFERKQVDLFSFQVCEHMQKTADDEQHFVSVYPQCLVLQAGFPAAGWITFSPGQTARAQMRCIWTLQYFTGFMKPMNQRGRCSFVQSEENKQQLWIWFLLNKKFYSLVRSAAWETWRRPLWLDDYCSPN